MANLFETGDFTLHSGQASSWKIDCDYLSDADIETLAKLIASRVFFSKVVGIPQGGLRLSKSLEKYISSKGPTLIVDDVITTGASMVQARRNIDGPCIGYAIFARKRIPHKWINALFINGDVIQSLNGKSKKIEGNWSASLTNMGIPKRLNGIRLDPKQRANLAIREKSQFRHDVAKLVDECKDYTSKAKSALVIAQEKHCPKEVLDAIQDVINVKHRKIHRKGEVWKTLKAIRDENGIVKVMERKLQI